MEQFIIYRDLQCPEGMEIEAYAKQVEDEAVAEMQAQGGKMTEKQLWILWEIGKILFRLVFHIPG